MRINLHWGISNLLVLTIIVAMLGTTQFALAKPHPPFPCWSCCPNGPLCPNDPARFYFRRMTNGSKSLGNQQAAGTPMTSTQWKNLATSVRNWQIEADGNGDMYDLQLFVQANKLALTAVTLDTSKFVPAMQSMGSTIQEAQLGKVLGTWTQAQRQTWVSNTLAYGMDWQVTNAISQLNAIANMVHYAEQHPGEAFPVRPFCDATMSVMIVWGFIAAAAVATADPFVAVAGLVSAGAGMAYALGGCIS
jgi:hypothetical protein